MAVQKITIELFLELAHLHPVLDVRSPGEFAHAHIPGAYNLPLFTDEERKVVGTAYKQESRQAAIKLGLDYFGVKMRKMVEETEELFKSRDQAPGTKNALITAGIDKETIDKETHQSVLVHCWRGGMRSAGVAWLLDLYGFKVYTLSGGYKIYRQWVSKQFEKEYAFNILGGYTGAGKTMVLQELKQKGRHVIDLESLANHKGSAFGALGEQPQPSQEMFENLLAKELDMPGNKNKQKESLLNAEPASYLSHYTEDNIHIEDESQRIGLLNIPNALWNQMRKSKICFLNIPFEERLNYITDVYGKFETEKLVNAVMRIQKRLGGMEAKNAISYLQANNHKECFRILLIYYDKCYNKALHNRQDLPLKLYEISCTTIDIKSIVNSLINENTPA